MYPMSNKACCIVLYYCIVIKLYLCDTYSRQQEQSDSSQADTLLTASSDSEADVDRGSLENLREMFPDQTERVLREALQENLDFDAAVDHVIFVANQKKGRW